MTKCIPSLMNGKPAVTVSMDVPDFLPRAPKINVTWLKGIVTEQVRQARVQRKRKRDRPRCKHTPSRRNGAPGRS
jgi:hypothetical protein